MNKTGFDGLKLKQVNEGMKCPTCKKYFLRKSHNYEWIDTNEVMMWDYACSNCGAKFREEDIRGEKKNE